ncbi:MAG: hypothetical protein ACI86S_002668, partial [Paracoccaceae bacterium]
MGLSVCVAWSHLPPRDTGRKVLRRSSNTRRRGYTIDEATGGNNEHYLAWTFEFPDRN